MVETSQMVYSNSCQGLLWPGQHHNGRSPHVISIQVLSPSETCLWSKTQTLLESVMSRFHNNVCRQEHLWYCINSRPHPEKGNALLSQKFNSRDIICLETAKQTFPMITCSPYISTFRLPLERNIKYFNFQNSTWKDDKIY